MPAVLWLLCLTACDSPSHLLHLMCFCSIWNFHEDLLTGQCKKQFSAGDSNSGAESTPCHSLTCSQPKCFYSMTIKCSCVVKRKTMYLPEWMLIPVGETYGAESRGKSCEEKPIKEGWGGRAILKMVARENNFVRLTWADSLINGLRNSLYVSRE